MRRMIVGCISCVALLCVIQCLLRGGGGGGGGGGSGGKEGGSEAEHFKVYF